MQSGFVLHGTLETNHQYNDDFDFSENNQNYPWSEVMKTKSGSKRTYFLLSALSLLTAILVLVGGCTTVVQPIEQYTSSDGYLSVSFPADWDVVNEVIRDGQTVVILASNNGIIDESSESPQSGLIIVLTPNFDIGADGEVETLTVDQMADMARFSLLYEPNTEVGEFETMTLDNGLEVKSFSVSDGTSDAAFYLFQLDEGVLGTALSVGGPGYDPNPMAKQVLSTLELSGDAESFLARAKELWGIE